MIKIIFQFITLIKRKFFKIIQMLENKTNLIKIKYL